jgi:CheY-like chemotaxis protein
MTKSSPLDPNILLVDDNRDGLLVRKTLLEEAGCRVQTAHNGEEGLKHFKSAAFDVVITDYRMPAMNGVEFIQNIRAHQPGVRVILLSGFVDPLGLTEENTGADVVIAKSCKEATHLIRWVKRLVNRTPRKPLEKETDRRTLRIPANLSH